MIYLKLSNLEPVSTAHSAGIKKVLSGGYVDLTRVTQMAWGRLEPGEIISKHNHPDMDECFFVTKGVGMITVDDEDFELSEGVFLIVPAMAWHSLTCVGEVLEFFYFGLQIYRKELV